MSNSRLNNRHYHRWGARVGYYQAFTNFTLLKDPSDYYSDLTATSTPQTESISLNLTDRYITIYYIEDHLKKYSSRKADIFIDIPHYTHIAHTVTHHTHTKSDIFIFLSFMNYIGSMKSYVKSNFHNNMDHHHEKYIKEYTIFLSTGSNVTHPRYVNVSVGGEFRTIHSSACPEHNI